MPELPRVGASLRETVEEQARAIKFEPITCLKCKLPAHPRGGCTNTSLCWYCEFPRP